MAGHFLSVHPGKTGELTSNAGARGPESIGKLFAVAISNPNSVSVLKSDIGL
jgi:hypothetical protein